MPKNASGIKLSNIDLCVVDGSLSLDRFNLLVKIATHCCSSITFNSVKVFSGCIKPHQHKEALNFEYIPISIHSVDEYSNFIIKDLHQYITAEYCLIFQHDGFIINPNAWSNDFLRYDYVGAVFPKADWSQANRVGNGGFSLRSKKFMKYCSTLCYPGSINEDKFLCVDHYDEIVSQGLKFAPPSLAAHFSIEEETEYNYSNISSFGFHGSIRRPHLYERTLHYINNIQ
jgi:hypothetical protein